MTTDPRHPEAGFAIEIALALLIVLGLIGGAALLMSNADERVAGMYQRSAEIDAAAGAGLERAVVHFQSDGASSGWPVTGSINGYSYAVTIRRDSFDYDADGTAGPVWHDRTAGYNESATGEPVYVLESTATKGAYRAVQRMSVAERRVTLDVPSSLTSNSTINLNGNVMVTGLNHDANGTAVDATATSYTGTCAENKAAVILTDSLETVATSSSNVRGNPAFADSTPAYTVHDTSVRYDSPEDVLGLDPGELDGLRQDASTYVAPDSIAGIVYVDGDYGSGAAGGNELNGTGVLIVHNPLFDPREHDPTDPMYDPVKAADPAYGPANLGNINGGTFHGAIIADKIDKINGNITILGGVVSLSEVDVTLVGAGTAYIGYSCDSLTRARNASSLPPDRLEWMAQ